MSLSDAEKVQLREALHKMNNALNSISMQAELARMYLEQNNSSAVEEALTIIMAQCRGCSQVSQSTQNLIQDARGGNPAE